MAALALRHVTFITSGKVFVLGGKTVQTTEGVATVDLDRPDADLIALDLWHRGYRIDENGDEIRNPGDLDALIASLTGSAEEAEVADGDPAEDAAVAQFVEALAAEALTADDEVTPED